MPYTYKAMKIADIVKEVVNKTPDGVILTVDDFGVDPENQQALVMSLSRMVKNGELEKISKGKYYKPKKSIFGLLGPSQNEIAKDFLVKGGKTVGYITGTSAFASMGLTTQISSALLIGTAKYRRPVKRGETIISFIVQANPITESNIPLLRILDAIKLIREIPATTPDEVVKQIIIIISNLSIDDLARLTSLSETYTSYVRAVLGAILEYLSSDMNVIAKVRSTLNGTTNYRLPISEYALPTKRNWNII